MPTTKKPKPVWFGMKVTPEQKYKIKTLAQHKGTSAKQALMDLVDEALTKKPFKARKDSFLAGVENLVGSVEGPADLSTNPRYMDGFGNRNKALNLIAP